MYIKEMYKKWWYIKIYKVYGLVVETKLNEEWITLLEDGKGMVI